MGYCESTHHQTPEHACPKNRYVPGRTQHNTQKTREFLPVPMHENITQTQCVLNIKS